MKLKKGCYYDNRNKRLVYINEESTPELWHARWKLDEFTIKNYMSKKDKRIIRITSRFLNPQDGVVLEGGCGYGSKVNSLQKEGYKVIGVDFDFKTVSFLNKHVPELNIKLGDVRALPLDDSSITGYWSLGVIEHFYNDYDVILEEMYRVIKPGGYLFLSHPYMSPVRKLKAALGLYPRYNCQERPTNFYQFALDRKAVQKKLEAKGFKLIMFKRSSGLLGFNEEVHFRPTVALKAYQGKNYFVKGLRYLINVFLSSFASHGCLMVLRLTKK